MCIRDRIYIAVMAAMDKPMGALGHKVWQTFVLVALICGAAQIFAKTPIEGENFVEKAAYLYESGTKLKGGGLAAGLIGIPLLSFGKTPAAVTVFLLIFTFLMLITGATPVSYTHLDVYKRQTMNIPGAESSYLEAFASAMGMVNGVLLLMRYSEQWYAWFITTALYIICLLYTSRCV